MRVSVCVCMCDCLSASIFPNYTSDLYRLLCVLLNTYGRGSVLLWRRSDTLCPSGFMDDVILADKPRLFDVAALKRSAHAALGFAINCAQ